MSLENLPTLKMKLIAEDSLDRIWEYFSEHFDSNETFMTLGRTVPPRDTALPDLVEAIGVMALREEGEDAMGPALCRVLKVSEDFSHGVSLLQGHLMRFFYFNDVEVGMVFVHLTGGEYRLARLTGRTIRIPMDEDSL